MTARSRWIGPTQGWLSALVCIIVLQSAKGVDGQDAPIPAPIELGADARELLQANCLGCHGAETQKGGMRLDENGYGVTTPGQAQHWQDVLDILNSSEMPPSSVPNPPSLQEQSDLIRSLTKTLVDARQRFGDSGGRVLARRLNRREYSNVIHDLLGVRVDLDRLPQDDRVNGFDTVGTALTVSPFHVQAFAELGRKALEELAPKEQPTAVVHRERPRVLSREQNDATIAKYKALIDAGGSQFEGLSPKDIARLPIAERIPWAQHLNIAEHLARTPGLGEGALLFVPRAGRPPTFRGQDLPRGRYLFRARVANVGTPPAGGNYLKLLPRLRAEEVRQLGGAVPPSHPGYLGRVRADITAPEVIEIPFTLDEDQPDLIALYCRQVHERDPTKLKLARDGSLRPNQVLRFWKTGLWLDWFEVIGPLPDDESQPDAHGLVFFDGLRETGPGHEPYVRQIVERFARRALRGVEPGQPLLDGALDLYGLGLQEGYSFESSVKDALSLVLASPPFLYLMEAGSEQRSEVSDLELASRLSFFLWSTQPDAELMDLARAGRLSAPAQLAEQVGRMLDSPRAAAFYENFVEQWLELREIDWFKPPMELDAAMLASISQEPSALFEHLVKHDLALSNLIRSDFTVVDPLLASFYGLEPAQQPGFQAVQLPKDSVRGGLLSQIIVLTMDGDGRRSMPVHRGAWVLRKLLDAPPAAPPPNVPAFSPDGIVGTRAVIELHRSNPACASCHQEMDTIGMGLENFGPLGRWRERERLELVASSGKRGNTTLRRVPKPISVPIDASGVLDQGAQPFADYRELRMLLGEKQDALVRGLSKALIQYGLGRSVSFMDKPFLDSLVRTTVEQDLGARSYLVAFLSSQAFRTK